MRSRKFTSLLLTLVLGAGVVVLAQPSSGEEVIIREPGMGVRAGVGVVDLSYHVGRNQGQLGAAGNMVSGGQFDPYVHSYTQQPTEGLQARLYARAIVVEGTDGNRVAYLKTDHYLQQDLLFRRVAQLVEAADVGIDRETLMIGATHNHSAPYGATTSWGVWVFADAFDLREFDYFATRMAQAVIDAANDLRPVRMGASVLDLTEVQQNILGHPQADDGSPAGFPRDHFDPELAVVRFDDISDPQNPEPYAMLVNLAMHPESLAGNGMLSPDFVGQVELHAERATGATVIWSQGGLGDVEPDSGARANPPDARKEYWRRDFRQMEEMSRVVAERTAQTWHDVEAGTSAKHIGFSTDFPVAMASMRFPGPASHPIPTVSNCRTEAASKGSPAAPIAGFPDCARGDGPDVGPAFDAAKNAGVPVPEHYGSAPGYTGAQETLHAHLQVMRLGEVVLASCPCEPVTDMTVNFKTRADSDPDDMYLGHLWPCDPKDGAPDTYVCDVSHADWVQPRVTREISKELFDKMRAQVLNDARGWDDETPNAILTAESEPTDPAEIKGNFTHEQIQDLACGIGACEGYTMPLMVGTANDYIGYVVTYREYQRGDHYRKALTAFGPHTSDYINTRLVRMAASLQGADAVAGELLAQTVTAEDQYLHARALAVGVAAEGARAAYEAALPDDGGAPEVVVEPSSLERFDGAQVRWVGGSNYTDNPHVRVERLTDGEWTHFANQDGGEVVTTIAYGSSHDLEVWAGWASGEHINLWTATFEVFDETPAGTYRFVIEGHHRSGGEPGPYELVSDSFDVNVWSGVEVTSGVFDPEGGEARFTVAPITYPETYEPVGVRYISTNITDTGTGPYCLRCTFRPWASEGEVAAARVTIVHSDGSVATYAAELVDGVWVATGLPSDAIRVDVTVGDVVDAFGNVNGVSVNLSGA